MILCCGEALIDMLPRKAGDEEAFAPYVGGAVLNTAVALARLGASSGFLSGVSSDLFGEMIEERLSSSGVDRSCLIRSDLPTTLAFVKLTDGQAQYVFYDENSAGRMIEPAQVADLPHHVDALFVGGIYLAREPAGSAYEKLAVEHGTRLPVMIDPNVRSGFITDETAYRQRVSAMMASSAIVKLSDEDLAWLFPDRSMDEVAGDLLGAGADIVLVTCGSKEVRGFTAHDRITVPVPKVEIADTVGAGDTFNAGVLEFLQKAGLLSREALRGLSVTDLRGAIERGVAAAAITVSRAGANPPYASELEAASADRG